MRNPTSPLKVNYLHQQADHSVDSVQEGPYFGRTRFVANQHAQESIISGATPQVIQTHTVQSSSTSLQSAVPSQLKEKMHAVLDSDLERKQAEVQKSKPLSISVLRCYLN